MNHYQTGSKSFSKNVANSSKVAGVTVVGVGGGSLSKCVAGDVGGSNEVEGNTVQQGLQRTTTRQHPCSSLTVVNSDHW